MKDEFQLEQEMEAQAFQDGFDSYKQAKESGNLEGLCEVCGVNVTYSPRSGRTYYCPEHVGEGLGLEDPPSEPSAPVNHRSALVTLRRGQDPDQALREVRALLPGNYRADLLAGGPGIPVRIRVEGVDRMGWTLEAYVIPRLASGNIQAEEV